MTKACSLQTMTTTDTRDVSGTVEQVKRCADMGADIVRITVQGKQEAVACHKIREQLFKDRYRNEPRACFKAHNALPARRLLISRQLESGIRSWHRCTFAK